MRALWAAGAMMVCGACALGQPGAPGGPRVGDGSKEPLMVHGVRYEKLATRAATEQRILDLAFPQKVKFGDWYALGEWAFQGFNKDDLKTVHPPEAELEKTGAGGPGPDLAATYDARYGKASWKKFAYLGHASLDLNPFCKDGVGKLAIVYVYTTIIAEEDTHLPVTMGADDGLRFWLNGKLLADQDVARGMDPEETRLTLELKKGVNHVFMKVSQGSGAFEYQINYRPKLDDFSDTLLQYQLDSDFPPSREGEYYRLHAVRLPEDVVLEVGGLDVVPDGRPLVCTRRGDVYLVDGAYDEPPHGATFTTFASGLHEPLGLTVRKEAAGKHGWVAYVVQRGELTRLVDTDGDDVADEYQTVSDAWGVSGNYHEFAFGGRFDREGNIWVALNVGFCGSLGKSLVPWRGWAVRITPAGDLEAVCDGLRSPNGVGMYSDGQMFYLDNQGDYVGTNRMSPLLPGSFAGHPAGLRWREHWASDGAPPEVTPATIWFPYRKLGQSQADFLLEDSARGASPGGKFGAFAGQVFVGDQTLCYVNRCTIEKIDGVYQGAAYPFRQGLQCGVNRLAWGKDGSMFVGQTDRGWASIGRRRYGLERIAWTGKVPFEVLEMRAQPDGFDLVFTKDADASAATNVASYAMSSYTYEYHAAYGSAEMDTKTLRITSATMKNPRTVHLAVEGLRQGGMGYVHELAMAGVKCAADADGAGGEGLVHTTAYYTMQKIPSSPR